MHEFRDETGLWATAGSASPAEDMLVRGARADDAIRGAVPVFPRLLDVVRMMNNPAEYECAKAAYIAEEGREGGPTAADEAEDEFNVEY